MKPEPAVLTQNSARRYLALLAVIVAVIGLWSGAWLYGRSVLAAELDRAIADFGRSGVAVGCADRRIDGYPFRFEVRCLQASVADRLGTEGGVAGFDAVALIYNPWHVIFEIQGPAAASDRVSGIKARADWTSARSSVIFSDTSASRIDAVIEAPRLSLESPHGVAAITADKAELHLRPVPDDPDALEAFLSLKSVSSSLAPNQLTPIDGRAHVRIANGMGLLAGQPIMSLAANGDGQRPVDLVWLSLGTAATEINASGPLEIDREGRISGEITVKVLNPEQAVRLAGSLLPPETGFVQTLQGAAVAFGQPSLGKDGRRQLTLPLTITRGVVRIGLIPLGVLPPLGAGAV